MADARLIWKKISECKQLAKCSIGANVLFERLIPHSDDDGRFYADPKIINKLIFTARDDITDKSVAEWLKELKRRKLIQIYRINGVPFLRLIKFLSHQHLRKDIQPKIQFPEPPKRNETKRNETKRAVTPKKVDITTRNKPLLEVKRREVKKREVKAVTAKPSSNSKKQVKMHDPLKWKEEQREKARRSKNV